MRLPAIIIVLALFLPLPALANDNGELVKVVVLSRHGVRSPTQGERVLSMWSQKPWPAWPVAKGDLTPRGAKLVTAMWSNLRGMLEGFRLLPDRSCPQAGTIYVRADTDERTKATAKAILDGLAPDCKLKFNIAKSEVDPLFHPVRAGLYRYNPILAATEVLDTTNGGLENLQDQLSGAISLVGSISGPPSAALCSRFALMPQCELEDLPNAISVSPDGSGIRIVGSLGIASSLAEIFLLEYGEWPDAEAGWGAVNASVLAQIMPVHSRIFDVVNRTPVVAWANGGALLEEMTAALFGEHGDQEANAAKLVVFVGHDTNIANVSGLLNFYWQVSGYPPNAIPPASALFLELWRKDGQDTIVARFFSQPPAALHAPFSGDDAAAHAPKSATIFSGSANPAMMRAEIFKALARKACENAPAVKGRQDLLELAE